MSEEIVTKCNDALYMNFGSIEYVMRCELPKGHDGNHKAHGNGYNQVWFLEWRTVGYCPEIPLFTTSGGITTNQYKGTAMR